MARRGRISLGERVYRSLCRDLAAGALDPTVRLGEERLAEAYRVSRTPVREALARLLSDGLVERRDNGLYPYRPRLDELGDLYELRIVLETRGIQRVRSAVLRDSRAHGDIDRTGDTTAPETFGGSRFGSPSALEVEAATLGADATAVPETTADPAIIAVARSGTTSHDQLAVRRELDHWRRLRDNPPEAGPGLVAADEQFHATLLTAAGNSALADALITVHAKIRPIRSLDMPTPDRIAAMTAEHIAIAEHILTGDLDRALDTLLTHILRSRANVLARARRALELTKLGQALRD